MTSQDLLLADLLDQREIEKVIHHYARSLDERRFADMEACFTPTAQISMSVAGTYPSPTHYRRKAEQGLAELDVTHHVFGSIQVVIENDRATATSSYHAQHVRNELQPDHLLLIGGWVHDDFVRTAAGWKIDSRRGTALWYWGNPMVLGRADLPINESPWRRP